MAIGPDNIEIDYVHQFRMQLKLRSSLEIVRRHIIYGNCVHLSDDQYYSLKYKISNWFSIHPSEIIVVGSAKLGFSIAPQKRYRLFNDKSDIDVAVVSSKIFDAIWKEVFLYSNSVTYWPDRVDFFKYLSRGWIRPDKLPRGKAFVLTKDWDNFFRSLSINREFGEYNITAGLYKDWLFLEKYQEKSVSDCVSEE